LLPVRECCNTPSSHLDCPSDVAVVSLIPSLFHWSVPRPDDKAQELPEM